jgi:1-phosphofructokinase
VAEPSPTDNRRPVTVFGPNPILGITIERRGADEDDIHVHPGGQGVWVARMAGEMGAYPILCGFCGGETGQLLRPLLDELPGETRLVETTVANGSWVIDRRSGGREMIAHAWSDPPTRDEIDDLFSVTTASALSSEVLVVCGPVPPESLPIELYGQLVKDVRAHGPKVVVDLSPPRLESALEGEPDIVKADEWQLAQITGEDTREPEAFRKAAEAVLERGAGAVIATRGADPVLVLTKDGRAWELVPPVFEEGDADGSGDSMVGTLAAALARGLDFEDALRLGAAAGATNSLRHGLGTGTRPVVEDLVQRVELRPLSPDLRRASRG